ncbi:MAG: EutN/CcmL family microcompartment protein [Oscillospiraceae bacterium]|nr:EutN/CcmL family microcompartment protein [Oscillospiraceae bacterium]
MRICQVIGHLWATKKENTLTGLKLMLVRELSAPEFTVACGDTFVAADVVGAGIGERVLVVSGSTARIAVANGAAAETAVDCAIVGIIDSIEMDKNQFSFSFDPGDILKGLSGANE